MDLLRSYWRMPYITAPTKEGEGHENPFALLPKLNNDKEALIVFRSSKNYLVLNKFPYNAGHLMAVPYREVAELEDLTDEERRDLMETIIKAKEILKKAFKPDGFNIGFNFGSAAGSGITKHLHCHIVPRWAGDTNFMPVIGNSRVLPEALDATWERLRQFC